MLFNMQYPNISGLTQEEKLAQIEHYLVMLKQELDFVLANIDTDNLSGNLKNQLSSFGLNIQTYKDEQEGVFGQIASKGSSVSDVLNSDAYKKDQKELKDSIPTEYLASVNENDGAFTFTDQNGNETDIKSPVFTVNFETGNLEYTS